MRRAAGLARALARGSQLCAALQPAAAPAAAAAACLGHAAAAQRALHAAAPLLPPAAAAAAAAGRPGFLPACRRLLRTAGAADAAQPAAAAPIAVPEPWRLVGRVKKPFPPQSRDIFAVVQAGPHQFKVTVDDLIYVEKMHGVDINDKVALPRVLMVGTPGRTVVGRPYVPSAEVLAVVEEQVRDAKVIIFKKRRRKNSRRTAGHRQQLTSLRVVDILEKVA